MIYIIISSLLISYIIYCLVNPKPSKTKTRRADNGFWDTSSGYTHHSGCDGGGFSSDSGCDGGGFSSDSGCDGGGGCD
ncbi:hypothetical protein [Bacillus atrophaeus]|uniref:hypothetical protein n=2 Tax=Bacillus atrophaeus TaxID=1452 RepID=UPI002E21AE47|nr:hypothetical protein [Bacillus atrophaeus]MED4858651.1 hypothetical protein [Bacillus atrophaeus]